MSNPAVVASHLSKSFGRKAVLLPGLAVAAASSLVFLIPHSLVALFAGRLLSGVSAGVFTGVATATLVDLAPENGRARAGLLAAVFAVSTTSAASVNEVPRCSE